MIRSIRYEIIKPIDSTWEDFGKILSELRYKSARIANYTVQLLWQWDNFRWEYKEEKGVFPDNSQKPNFYKLLRNRFPEVGTSIIGQTSRWVENRYSSIRKDMFMLRKSVLSFKDNMPILLNNQSYKIYKEEKDYKDYIFNAALQSKLADGNTRYCFLVKTGESAKRAILDKVISGLYKKCMLQIVPDSKHKWYVILSYEYEPQKHESVNDRVMDLIYGNTPDKAITMKIRKTNIERVIPVSDVLHTMQMFNARLKALREQKYYTGENRKGHGSKKLIAPIQGIQDKINNYKSTTNHKYSRLIVGEAIRYKCSRIKVSGDSFFMDWPLSDLSYKIKYKAEEAGIRFSDGLDIEE